jgi:gluconate kinase
MGMNTVFEKFRDWSPIRIYWQQQPFVDWCYLGEERFTHPFFDNTIELLTQRPFNLLFRHQTSIEFLGEMYEQNPGLAPNGFIFHMSRCGSTLVAQMLSSLAQNIVISEPPAIDSILRSNTKNPAITDRQRIDWLKWIVSAFGQKRNDEKYYFIKFDSWSMIDLDLIRRAFPEVPWIFLYRNPIEVLVSQMRERGSQMIPGAIGQILPGLDFMETLQMPPEEYCARVLARFCENAIGGAKSGNALMINYNQLPEVVTSAMIEHFQINYSPEDIENMKNAARFNAKTPGIPFASDSAAKRNQASDAARQAAEKWINPLYEQLEKIRFETV